MGDHCSDGFDGSIGGSCPVQGYGTVDGHAWYFRARGEHWALHIAAIGHDDDVCGAGEDAPGWCVWAKWCDDTYGAGYMPEAEAWQLIEGAISTWRGGNAEYFSGACDPSTIDDGDIATMEERLARGVGSTIFRDEVKRFMSEAIDRRVTKARERYGGGVPEDAALSEIAKARRATKHDGCVA